MSEKTDAVGNPEFLLNEFTQRLLRLRAACSFVKGQEHFDEDLQKLIRKFRISSVLANRYTVCIAGSQGAGKTTFLRGMYALDKTWLDDNAGRGEKVPILIVEEDDIKEPWGEIQVITRAAGGSERIEDRKVTATEFRGAVKNWTSGNILPVLHVPCRHFAGRPISFLLLPGYEVGTETSRYWQDLMRHALLASAACVVVTDNSMMAESTQAEILRDMQKHFLEGSKPVIAVARTENSSPDTRNELMATAAKVFDVNLSQEDRVVCVGTGNEEYLESWRRKVITALQDYAMPSDVARQRKLSYLDGLLSREVPEVLGVIQMHFSDSKRAISTAEREVNKIIEEFDQGVSRLRVKYRRELSKSLQIHAGKAAKAGKNRYQDEEEGLANTFGNTFRWFGTTSGEREDIHLDRINDVWKLAAGEPAGFSPAFSELLRTLTFEGLHIAGASAAAGGKTTNQLGYGGLTLQEEPKSDLTPAVQVAIGSLFNPNREGVPELAGDERKEMQKAIKLVPVLALEYVRLNQIFLADTIQGVAGAAPKPLNLQQIFQSADESVRSLSDSHSGIIKSISTILAIDVAADGKIDTIPALFSAIKELVNPETVAGSTGAAGGSVLAAGGGATAAEAGTATAAGTTAASVAMVAAGAVVVAFVAYSFINQVQQQDAAHRHFITVAINAIRDQHLARYTEIYDELMQRIRETLENRLSTRYRLDEEVGRRDSVVRALTQVEVLRGDLQEAIRGDYAMG